MTTEIIIISLAVIFAGFIGNLFIAGSKKPNELEPEAEVFYSNNLNRIIVLRKISGQNKYEATTGSHRFELDEVERAKMLSKYEKLGTL